MSPYDPRSHFDALAEKITKRKSHQDCAGRDSPFFRWKRRQFIKHFGKLPLRGKLVLEVGCGPGGNLEKAYKAGPARLCGCDISPKMIETARRFLKEKNIDAQLKLSDGDNVPFDNAEFDIVYTVTVLQHNSDAALLASLISDLCRVSRDSVILVEDTAPREKGWPTYMRRPIAFYEAQMKEHGFHLTGVKRIEDFWSEKTANKIILKWKRRQEVDGEGVHFILYLILAAILPVTRLLDRLFPKNEGLSFMFFKKTNAGDLTT